MLTINRMKHTVPELVKAIIRIVITYRMSECDGNLLADTKSNAYCNTQYFNIVMTS